ncbi:MAG: hypothetical protein IJ043_03285 [Clostridia bacterium]|nr:hypothetical protein [Clostridia bacterium]
MEKFRVKRRLKVPYHTQGYIYFVSRNYKKLPKEKRERIEANCRRSGGEHWQALFEFVTKDTGAVEICRKYFISAATLERAVQRYYEEFPGDL